MCWLGRNNAKKLLTFFSSFPSLTLVSLDNWKESVSYYFILEDQNLGKPISSYMRSDSAGEL